MSLLKPDINYTSKTEVREFGSSLVSNVRKEQFLKLSKIEPI